MQRSPWKGGEWGRLSTTTISSGKQFSKRMRAPARHLIEMSAQPHAQAPHKLGARPSAHILPCLRKKPQQVRRDEAFFPQFLRRKVSREAVQINRQAQSFDERSQ